MYYLLTTYMYIQDTVTLYTTYHLSHDFPRRRGGVHRSQLDILANRFLAQEGVLNKIHHKAQQPHEASTPFH